MKYIDNFYFKRPCEKCALSEILEGFTKRNAHRALDDIQESIEELRYYRIHFLRI